MSQTKLLSGFSKPCWHPPFEEVDASGRLATWWVVTPIMNEEHARGEFMALVQSRHELAQHVNLSERIIAFAAKTCIRTTLVQVVGGSLIEIQGELARQIFKPVRRTFDYECERLDEAVTDVEWATQMPMVADLLTREDRLRMKRDGFGWRVEPDSV